MLEIPTMAMTTIDIILPEDSVKGLHAPRVYHGGDTLTGFISVNTFLEESFCAVITFEGLIVRF